MKEVIAVAALAMLRVVLPALLVIGLGTWLEGRGEARP
jgi:hypothetical protein